MGDYEKTPDWPKGVKKPSLPEPYEFCCLRPAFGIGEPGKHPWWIRVHWKTKDGKERVLKTPGYFPWPRQAISYAVEKVEEHRKMRAKYDQH